MTNRGSEIREKSRESSERGGWKNKLASGASNRSEVSPSPEKTVKLPKVSYFAQMAPVRKPVVKK